MKKIAKAAIVAVLLLSTLLLVTSCSGNGVFSEYDKEGFNVSIKYDANGGTFTTNTTVIIDTYKLSDLPTNSEGMKEIVLLEPENVEIRGKENAFNAQNSGYFFAGWYTSVEPVTDENGNHLDIYGNIIVKKDEPKDTAPEGTTPEDSGESEDVQSDESDTIGASEQIPAYKYSGKWDFKNDKLEVDPNKNYTSAEPVITLYARWVPKYSYEFEFYSYSEPNKLLGTLPVNPRNTVYDAINDAFINHTIKLPQWNVKTGKINMGDVPVIDGYTFNAIYTSPESTEPITADTLTHVGGYNDNMTPKDTTMKLYVDLREGDWYKIHTAEQFLDNWSLSGCYEIMSDLDFTGKFWKTSAMYREFKGTILGNGHKMSNITLEHSSANETMIGLFGSLGETAVIKDVVFENVTLDVKTGSIKGGDVFCGLFASSVADGAKVENVSLTGGHIVLHGDSDLVNLLRGVYIGLICVDGVENVNADLFEIDCNVVGGNLSVSVNGNNVTVTRTDSGT